MSLVQRRHRRHPLNHHPAGDVCTPAPAMCETPVAAPKSRVGSPSDERCDWRIEIDDAADTLHLQLYRSRVANHRSPTDTRSTHPGPPPTQHRPVRPRVPSSSSSSLLRARSASAHTPTNAFAQEHNPYEYMNPYEPIWLRKRVLSESDRPSLLGAAAPVGVAVDGIGWQTSDVRTRWCRCRNLGTTAR